MIILLLIWSSLLTLTIIVGSILFYFLNRRVNKLIIKDIPFLLKSIELQQENDETLHNNDKTLLKRVLIVEKSIKTNGIYKSKHRKEETDNFEDERD